MESYIVFDPRVLLGLANDHRAAFEALGHIEQDLNIRFAEMQDPILALILAVASGEPLLFKGPTGTAKSWLVREFCRYIGIDPAQSGQTTDSAPSGHTYSEEESESEEDLEVDYFEYLLTPFTEPGELFGYFDIAKASNEGVLERDSRGMMQHAKVVYLDEVFKGSSAILNSLLAFMNERIFHDRGRRVPVKLQCLFGATNEVPLTSELRAIYDRFLLRCDIENIKKREDLGTLLNKGWKETYGNQRPEKEFPKLLDDLAAFREQADQLLTESAPLTTESEDFLGELAARVIRIRQHGLSEMSNRRVIKFVRIMMIHSIYRYVYDPERSEPPNEDGIKFTEAEISLWRFILDRRDELAEEHL